jgi:hypothetical protein
MDEKLARLKEIGFTVTGHWTVANGGIACELNELANSCNVLYAFAVDDQLMYVGKTVQPLRARLAGYRNPGATQSTNIKNNRNIRECLAQDKQIVIYVLPDSGLLHYGGFHLNQAAGLEDSLVRDLDPPWNGGRKELPSQLLSAAEVISSVPDQKMLSDVTYPARVATAKDFRTALSAMLVEAAQSENAYVDVNAGQLHRRVGGYPGTNHRMPVCCDVMRAAMHDGDSIVKEPPKGRGASLTVRYAIPRQSR